MKEARIVACLGDVGYPRRERSQREPEIFTRATSPTPSLQSPYGLTGGSVRTKTPLAQLACELSEQNAVMMRSSRAGRCTAAVSKTS